jgi:hypothetical protein
VRRGTGSGRDARRARGAGRSAARDAQRWLGRCARTRPSADRRPTTSCIQKASEESRTWE